LHVKAKVNVAVGNDLVSTVYFVDVPFSLYVAGVTLVDVNVDVVYGRRGMPLCPPPQYNTSRY